MAKILTFRGKEQGSADLDFLADENQTLSFRTPEDGSSVSLGQIPQASLFPDPRKDWSNQELADLFKVRQLLSGANVVVETDRGVTDEGDPWFVFCHGSGEVFIHLCRVDGFYLLDSPNVMRPLRGANFGELIADFTNQALPAGAASESDTERRVIRLERGGKVRLHPSAMLAALIWTLFLASEELVLLAPEETDVALDDDSLLNFEGMFAVEGGDQVLTGGLFEDEVTMVTDPSKGFDQEAMGFVPETQGQIREAALHQQGLAAQHNCFSIGLSTIAIAMGFMSEAVLLDNQRKVLEQLKQLGFTEYGQDTEGQIEISIAENEGNGALLGMLADFLGLELPHSTTEVTEGGIKTTLLQQEENNLSIEDMLNVNTVQPIQLPQPKTTAVTNISNEEIDVDAESAEVLTTSAKKQSTAETTEISSSQTTPENVHDIEVVDLSDILTTAQLGQVTTTISLDISSLDTFELFDTSIELPKVKDVYNYDSMAQRLMDFFKSKGGEIGFIEQGNGFIAVDRQAVKSGDVDYIQWETNDGKIISVIGLQEDFEYFDMIA